MTTFSKCTSTFIWVFNFQLLTLCLHCLLFFSSEEREDAWRQQKGAWDNEILVWDQLIVKLLNSNYLLIKEKLEGALNTQREHFQDRFAKFDQLTSYVNEIKLDTDLHSVLYKDITVLSEK